MDILQPLLGKTLVLVAHPDDEVITCGALLQKMREAVVVFATDGAPRDEYFWKSYESREAYAAVRRREAHEVLTMAGARALFLPDSVPDGIADQELFKRLPHAVEAFTGLVEEHRPDCLLTLAYEGGHPDHDSACFIAARAGAAMGVPVWEAPLYHRKPDGGAAAQTFHRHTGSEVEARVEGVELQTKLAMFAAYKSQNLVLDGFKPQIEKFRPLADYDFTTRPVPWKLNYELWQWPMTGEEVAAAFTEYMRRSRLKDFRTA